MNDKYNYTGPNNSLCPICDKRTDTGLPVIIFVNGSKYIERKWCMSCFGVVRSLDHRHEESIRDVFIPELTEMIGNLIPPYHTVRGYWFAVVPKQGLTLVMEVV